MSPFIRGFQDNMSVWVGSLIQQQEVAQQATQGRAQHAAMPSQYDHVSYLREQLAHR